MITFKLMRLAWLVICSCAIAINLRADIDWFEALYGAGADDTVVTSTMLANGARGLGNVTITNFTAGNNTANQCRIEDSFGGPFFTGLPIAIGGTNFTASGLLGCRWYYTNSQRAFVRYVTPNASKLTFGCYMRLSSGWTNINFSSQDLITLTFASGDFLVLNLQNHEVVGTGTNFLQAHTQLGTAETVGGANAETNLFPATPGTTIYVSGKVDVNEGTGGTAHLWFFETNTMKRVATSVLGLDSTTSDRVQLVQFGQYEPHGVAQPAGTYIDFANFCVDTNGTHWPLMPASKVRHSPTASRADVNATITAATDGDHVRLPKDTNTWTSGVSISKNSLSVAGIGAGSGLDRGTNTTVIIADGVFNAFSVSGNYNVFSNFQVRGDLSNFEATGFDVTAGHNRFTRLHLRELAVAIFARHAGLVDNCVFVDNDFVSRNIFGNSYYNTFYPLPRNSTNAMYYEDNLCYVTSGYNGSGANAFMSSQEGQCFVVRHNYFEVNNSSYESGPGFDYHGDWDPGSDPVYRPGVFLGIYSNYFNYVSIGDLSGHKFVDIRGGESEVYSNKVVGKQYSTAAITYREEHPEDSSPYYVTNSYNWQNFDGVSGTHAMDVQDDGNAIAGRNYTNVAKSPLLILQYPHPMRGEGGAPPLIPPERTNSWGTWIWRAPSTIGRTVYLTYTAGSPPSAATLNTEIGNCPSNQVIEFEQGVYNFTTPIQLTKSGVTLRGKSGHQVVFKNDTSTSDRIIEIGSDSGFGTAYTVWTNDIVTVMKGSSNLNVTATPTGIAVDDIIQIDQLEDDTGGVANGLVDASGNSGHCDWCGRTTGTRPFSQTLRVVAINNVTNITFEPPLFMDFNIAQSIQIVKLLSPIRLAGLENLIVSNTVSVANSVVIRPRSTYRVFLKDCTFRKSYRRMVDWVKGLQNSVTGCTFRDGVGSDWDTGYGPDRGYGMYIGFGTSHNLIEDNIFEKLSFPIAVEGSGMGTVVAYNFATNLQQRASDLDTPKYVFGNHGAHQGMILYEGNYSAAKLTLDHYFGSSSHWMFLRNRNFIVTPQNGTAVSQYWIVFDMWTNNVFHTVVGNVFGLSGTENKLDVANGDSVNSGSSVKAIRRLGNMDANLTTWANYDPTVSNTLRWSVNWLSRTNTATSGAGIHYDSTIGDTNVPASLYLTNKLAVQGTLPWPYVNPFDPNVATATNLAAGYRFYFGNNPPPEGSATPPAQATIGAGRVRNVRTGSP